MAKWRRSVRRATVGKRERVWASVGAEAVNAAVPGAYVPAPIVLPVDWVRGTNFERGAVLAGIRGWYQVSYNATSTSVAPSWYLSISKGEVDEDHSAEDWTDAATYNSEDVLWTDGGHISIATATPSSGIHLARQLEVKTKRKLNSDDAINLNFMTPSASQDWTISGIFRALILLP